jgi:hypothetical protein
VCTRPLETIRKRKFRNKKNEITSGQGILPGDANDAVDLWAALILICGSSKNAGAND